MRLYVHFKTYKKIVSIFLIVCFLVIPLSFLTLPQKAEATCIPSTAPAVPDPLSVPVHLAATSVTNQANQAMQTMGWFKNCWLDGMATLIAKTIIKSLTKSIVSWINSGFKGNPSFVENVGSFMGGIADKVSGQTIESIAPQLCSPFRLDIELALATKQVGTNDSISCTLSDVENNFSNVVNGINVNVNSIDANNNSSATFWSDWFNVTQNPQNNPYGAMMIAQNQVDNNVKASQNKYQQQLDWGKGFLSFEDCSVMQQNTADALASNPHSMAAAAAAANSGKPTTVNITKPSNNSLASVGSLGLLDSILGDNSINSLAAVAAPVTVVSGSNIAPGGNIPLTNGSSLVPTGYHGSTSQGQLYTNSNDTSKNKQVYDSDNQPVNGVMAGDNSCITKTPGAVIESQLENTLGSDLRGLELAQSIDQIVSALVGQLVSSALGGIGGLLGAGSNSSSGDSSNYNQNLINSLNSVEGGASGNAAIPNLPIVGSCMPSTQNAQIGDTVTWNAIVPSINGNVTYQWYGDENLSGTSSSASVIYTSNGEKTASVLVSTTGSTTQSVQMDCIPSVEIGSTSSTSSVPTISCTASQNTVSLSMPTPVTWQAVAVGGVPPFTYSWSGDDGLTGISQSTIKTYTTAGIKTATVYVTSADGNTYLNTCNSTVNVTP